MHRTKSTSAAPATERLCCVPSSTTTTTPEPPRPRAKIRTTRAWEAPFPKRSRLPFRATRSVKLDWCFIKVVTPAWIEPSSPLVVRHPDVDRGRGLVLRTIPTDDVYLVDAIS